MEMTQKQVFDFCWEYKRDYFNHDSFKKRFIRTNWNFEDFKLWAINMKMWMKSMDDFSNSYGI